MNEGSRNTLGQKTPPLQVHFLTQGNERLPSVRFRILPYAAIGSETGYHISWQRIPKSFFSRSLAFLRMPACEALVIQKKLLPMAYLNLLKRRCQRLYYDFDDAVWTHHPGAKRRSQKDGRRFGSVCRRVDGVIAGNAFLAERASAYQPYITILPTPIDTRTYRPRQSERPQDRPLQVGWMGTAANQHFLPAVLDLLDRLPLDIKIGIISNENRLGSLSDRVTYSPWSGDQEVTQLQNFDVGLMPLSDDTYTRGKCGFKLLQYMACGVVPVASAVGFNREIIDHGVDGFLVEEATDWGRFVTQLCLDARLRNKMAHKAREKAVTRFDLRPSAERLWQALGLQSPEETSSV